jgi:hypothetical protein
MVTPLRPFPPARPNTTADAPAPAHVMSNAELQAAIDSLLTHLQYINSLSVEPIRAGHHASVVRGELNKLLDIQRVRAQALHA